MTSPTMEIPNATKDKDRAIADLQKHGLCVLEDAIDQTMLKDLREVVYLEARTDPARTSAPHFNLDRDSGNQRIWNLPRRSPLFVELVEHPLALELVQSMLGWPFLLSNFSANIANAQAGGGELHADQFFVPQPWNAAQGVNICWCIDDFTAENGATEIVPGSVQMGRSPENGEKAKSIPVVAKAGSIIALDGRLWHRTGINKTESESRAALFAWYSAHIYRTQENWFLSLDPSVVQFGSKTLLTLLGYHTKGLGVVNGISPLWRNFNWDPKR